MRRCRRRSAPPVEDDPLAAEVFAPCLIAHLKVAKQVSSNLPDVSLSRV
jgi:hypothetical protein